MQMETQELLDRSAQLKGLFGLQGWNCQRITGSLFNINFGERHERLLNSPYSSNDWGVYGDWRLTILFRERMMERDRQRGRSRTIPADTPLPGEFDVDTALEDIQAEVDGGENVIANTTDLNAQDRASLEEAIGNAGLSDNVVFYP